jgi:ThiF family
VALASYFDRSAVAAAQAIAGFDPDVFASTAANLCVGLSIDSRSTRRREGRLLADLTLRLFARLYPSLRLDIDDAKLRQGLSALALEINPVIDLQGAADIGVAIGPDATRYPTTIFAGSRGWLAQVGSQRPYTVGQTGVPFGPGVAACLAAANVFRRCFLGGDAPLDADSMFSAFDVGDYSRNGPASIELAVGEDAALIGAGAIGNGALWALRALTVRGALVVVDPQAVELSNLQRYVLADISDVGAAKTGVVQRAAGGFSIDASPMPVAEFVAARHYGLGTVMVALDSARDRRAVQSSLPRRVINAWTQQGDLGVSVHAPFGSGGACLECLYLAQGKKPNEDELVAAALGVPDQLRKVRELLDNHAAVGLELARLVASRLNVAPEEADKFAGKLIRELYVAGVCGGALVPLRHDNVPGNLHVPLAHQSALAGVLLAAAFVRATREPDPVDTVVSRLDVMRPVASHLSQFAKPLSGCICRDPDWQYTYALKWAT